MAAETTEIGRKKLDEKLRRKRINKAKTTARKIAPVVVLIPTVGAITNYAVAYVSAPSHLYPLLQSADAKAKAKQESQTSQSINQLAQSINKSASQLASLSSQSAANQSAVGSISNGINSIRNTPIPTLGPLAAPPTAQSPGSSSGLQSQAQARQSTPSPRSSAPAATRSAPTPPIVAAAPPIQLPAATTRPSQLG